MDFTPEQTGSFQYLARFSTDLGGHWTYAYTDDSQRGALTVNPSSDTTPPGGAGQPAPDRPVRPASITIGWNANSEPDLYRYEVWRSTTSGGPYTKIANVPAGHDAVCRSGGDDRRDILLRRDRAGYLVQPLAQLERGRRCRPRRRWSP